VSREIIPLPLNHNFGLGHIYCTHLNGGSAYILDGLRSIKSFYNCFDLNYDALALSPSMLKILLSDIYLNKTISAFSKLKYMVVNSEKLPADMIELLLNSCPNLRLMYYYGLTEASRSFFITFNKENKQYFHSVGKPTSSNVKVRIVDDEIHIGGDHLFSGYWNEDNSQIQNGFFPTGDLGYLDKEGYLFITGRKKDQINVGGLKVSAEEIKSALLKISGIDDAVVVALNDSITGEVPGALVVGAPRIDDKFITLELRKQLEIYAIPKKIIFSDTIPRSDTGKILISEVIKIIDKK
jgi:long-chain acyl-CoA synthetase